MNIDIYYIYAKSSYNVRLYIYIYIYIYIYRCIYRYTYIHRIVINVMVRLPHPRSGDNQGQETFFAPSANN